MNENNYLRVFIERRRLLFASAAWPIFAWTGAAYAQVAGKIARIGFLGSESASGHARMLKAFRDGLRELGYVEGRNVVVEYRWAEGQYERLSDLADELVRLEVDVLVTHATPGTLAAKRATATIPIVIATSGDAVAMGLVASLAKPGGNVTGSSFFSPELNAKRIEMLKEILPNVKRIGVLVNTRNSGANEPILKAMENAARLLKIDIQQFGVQGPNDFAAAMTAMVKSRVDAIVVREDPMFRSHAKTIADLAFQRRLPAAGFEEFVDAGGLMAYGVNTLAMYRRAAMYVDKILRGTKPSELPVEQAMRFDLVLNQKTAKTLGIKFPQAILIRTTRVIE